ncbi:hypothetical protein Clacol_002309 [Clathrus columnatus]|uniref:Uncharacterized protein n=1 Tax=Clathrus columnatus TaxID=1419009 RepID=A0AAV5A0C9_9AGAM|nr:hypothetical protein Clacol_002309 [Clathrus columnatus]
MTSFDRDRCKWRDDPEVPGRFIRELVGGELIQDIWNVLRHGDGNLFLGLDIKLSTSLDAEDFMAHLRQAWKSLRWDVPIVALQIVHVPIKGFPLPKLYMVYDVATSASEANTWAEDTVLLKEGYKDLDDLRYQIGQDPLPPTDLKPETYVYVLPKSPDSFGLLIHASHAPFDGAGLKIVGNKLLSHLANYIGNPDYQNEEVKRMRWGSESANLVPAVLDVVQRYEPAVEDSSGNIIEKEIPGEIREGPVYEKTLAEVMDGLDKGLAHSHPFKSIIQPMFDVRQQNPRTRRICYTFTLEESVKIKNACAQTKSPTSEKLTVNHLRTVHGSLSLLPILDNPPEKNSNAVIFFWGIFDSRRKLIPQYHNHPGYCLAMSPIQIPVSLYERFSGEDQRTLVLEFSKAIYKEYKKQAGYSSLVSIVGEEADRILQGPPLPPWCGPWYSGDGRGSLHLSPNHEVEGRQILQLSDFFLGLNRCEPGPFFRAAEWNGRITLSVDFNELAVEPKVVQRWMDLWRDLLLTI